jgi:hypothetical protein
VGGGGGGGGGGGFFGFILFNFLNRIFVGICILSCFLLVYILTY